ncbi:MAG TPA: hypothetical protein VGY99_19095 [Candidatus Binataceae bacterium]|nr:hypothetical protein [Candidatus Binataceae bacterium]
MKRIIVILSSMAVFTALAAFAPPAHASSRRARIQACADKSAGDPCSYTRKGANVDGTCGTARHGKLICTASSAGAGEPSGGAMAPSGGAAGGDTGGAMAPPSGSTGGTESAPSGGGEAPAPGTP